MPHFVIPSLGHGPGGFVESSGSAQNTGQSILGGGAGGGVESGLSTRRIQNQISDLFNRNVIQSSQFQFENVQVPLFDLQRQSDTISDALNTNIAIREQQRSEDLISLSKTNDFITNVQGQLNDFKENLKIPSQGGSFDPIKFITDNPLLAGIGTGSLIVGGIVLFLLLKR